MKQVTIIVGEPIIAPKFINLYKLALEYMHGDADAYTKSDFFFDSKTLKFVWPHLGYEFYEDDPLTLTKALEFLADYRAKINSPLETKVSEYEMLVGDCTVDHQWPAKITAYTLTYFDAAGEEFKVKHILEEV